MFVDESGNGAVTQKSLEVERYLGLTGCIFEESRYREFQASVIRFKNAHFPQHPPQHVSLQRTDILNKRGVFCVLQDKARQQAFDDDLLALLRRSRFRVVAIVLDKKNHISKYGQNAKHPYHYAAEALLERYCLYLANQKHAIGDVVAESRNPDDDRQLQLAWNYFHESGTANVSACQIRRLLTTADIKFDAKDARIDGLDFADLLANPAKNHILIDHGLRGVGKSLFSSKITAILADKYDCRWCGKIPGYGRVFLSNKNTAH
jgi:hypothetical protein